MNWLKNGGIRSFLLIWIAQLVSIVGSGLTGFGLGAWVVHQTGRTTDYAMIGLASTIPGALLQPVIGVLVDRWHRRQALLVAEGMGLLASIGLMISAFTGHLQIWQIWVSAFIQSIAIGFTWPAISAVTTMLVPKRHLARASAMMGFNDAAAMLLGPAIGGFVLVFSGLNGILIADVLTFVFSIAILGFVANIPDIPAHQGEPEAPRSMWEDIRFGWDYVRQRPGLVGLLNFFMVANFLWSLGFVVMMPMLLGLYRADLAGRMVAFEGIGVLVSTVAVAILGAPRNRTRGVIAFNAIGATTLMLAAAPPTPSLYCVVFFVMAFFGSTGYACSQSIWQSKVDPAIQGRVFSIRRMLAGLGTPLSMLLAGPLADQVFGPAMHPQGWLAPVLGGWFGTGFGAGTRVLLLGLGALAAANATIAWRNRHVRDIDRELPDFDLTPKLIGQEQSERELASA